jgi:hypothetical protein
LFGSALSGVLPAAAWDVPIVLNMKRTALPQAQSAKCVSFKDVRLPKRILHVLGDCLHSAQTITKQKQKNHAVQSHIRQAKTLQALRRWYMPTT